MNLANCSFCVVTVWLTSFFPGPSKQQNTFVHAQSSTQDGLSLIAQKTIAALRKNDAMFLSRVVDPTSIFIGIDAPRLSAARFRDELQEKRGAYCLIFSGCPNEQSKQSHENLRELLIDNRISLVIQTVDGGEERAVAIKRSKNPDEVLFTLLFRPVENGWVLQQIEFF